MKLTIARPISAPYSSCSCRSDSGEPSKPDRLASTTSGRLPLAVLIDRAAFFDDRGNSVPAVNVVGPSTGTRPRRGSGRDSMPSISTGCPPRCASSATTPSASTMSTQRSSVGWSASATARMIERMSNGFLRPGLSREDLARRVAKSVPGPACGESETSRSTGSVDGAGRGNRSPGAR